MKNTTYLGIAGAATLTALVAIIGLTSPAENTYINFAGVVDDVSVTAALNRLGDAEATITKGETLTVVLTTPGGAVGNMTDYLERMLNTKLHTITRINSYAASCGATMFSAGDEREMLEGSVILFHKIRITLEATPIFKEDTTIFEEDITDYLEGRPVLPEIAKRLATFPIDSLIKIRNGMASRNKQVLEFLTNRFGAEVANALQVGREDVVLTAEQAFAKGIATKIVKRTSNRN